MASSEYKCNACGKHFNSRLPHCVYCQSDDVELLVISRPTAARRSSPSSKTAKALASGWVSSSGIMKPKAAKEDTVYFKVPNELKVITSSEGMPRQSLYFLYGPPGIGKSTIVLAFCDRLIECNPEMKVLIISSEESSTTVGNKIIRLSPRHADSFELITTNSIYNDHLSGGVLAQYDLVVVDSISAFIETAKEVSTFLRQVANEGTTVIMIGHVIKSGSHEGPNTIAHIADAEWSCSGDRNSATRVLLMPKSRFSQTGVIFYELQNNGVKLLEHESSEYLLARQAISAAQPGSVLSTLSIANRFVPVDIQVSFADMDSGLMIASTNVSIASIRTVYSTSYRYVKRGGIVAVQINGVEIGGFSSYNQPDIALPLAIAMISAAQKMPISVRTAVVGTVDLSGRIYKPFTGLFNRVERLIDYADVIYGPYDKELMKNVSGYVPVKTIGEIVQRLNLAGEPTKKKYKNSLEAELAEGTPEDDGFPDVTTVEENMFED